MTLDGKRFYDRSTFASHSLTFVSQQANVATPRATETGLASTGTVQDRQLRGEIKMKMRSTSIFAVVCAFAMMFVAAAPAQAQDQPKEKPPMYSYVAFWDIPRAQWGEMEKAGASSQNILDKAMADGTIIGFGYDTNEVHQADGPTHDSWWSSMSMAGLLNVLDKFAKSASPSPVLGTSTKHWDNIMVSRFYNWHSGSYKGAYTRVASYKLKPDAPNDALEMLSKTLFVPLFEKLISDGTVIEYEIDTEAIHTEDPSTFWIAFVTPNAEGMDKFDVALRQVQKTNPLGGPALGSMVDFTNHRDYLESSTGSYK